jgi:hypothetical protein
MITLFLLKDNYPKEKYSKAEIIKDTKNILDQFFLKNTAN